MDKLTNPYKFICDKIMNEMLVVDNLKFLGFRDLLYDIFIYNLDITDCVWYMLTHFINVNNLHDKDIPNVLKKTYTFLQYYNNNYRPIYHLESYLFYLISIIHEYK